MRKVAANDSITGSERIANHPRVQAKFVLHRYKSGLIDDNECLEELTHWIKEVGW